MKWAFSQKKYRMTLENLPTFNADDKLKFAGADSYSTHRMYPINMGTFVSCAMFCFYIVGS